jgi:hypothetical protein
MSACVAAGLKDSEETVGDRARVRGGIRAGVSVYAHEQGIEYDLHVPPGAGASKIRLAISGADERVFRREDRPIPVGHKLARLSDVSGRKRGSSGGLIAADPAGDVVVTGTTTSTDYPVTDSSVRTSGANNTVPTEVDPTGSNLL